MANIQILDNPKIHDLLINLSKEETIAFRQTIEQTFEQFSVDGERQHQPMPTVANRPSGQHTLFRPFTSDSSVGTKIIVNPPLGPDGQKDPLHGIILLCDGKGNPTGILSAEEVTGYRTAMNAMVPFCWRRNVRNVLIFGGGVQAIWHTRLILALRGEEVKNITFVNRSKERIDKLIATVVEENQVRWKSTCTFHFINSTSSGFEQELKSRLAMVDCIFCTTPSKKPLFPSSYLTKETDRLPFISAVGSWQTDMIELDPELLRLAVATSDGYNPVTGVNQGTILTDDRDFALSGCGELVQSRVTAKDVVELGEIIGLKNGKDSSSSLTNVDTDRADRFISEGFVIYKSVGLSLTDLTSSNAILRIFNEKQQK